MREGTKYDAMSASVVATGERAEALLSCRIPDRQLQPFAVYV